jgi:DNA repair exonuclease SbcCD nuclease subunit
MMELVGIGDLHLDKLDNIIPDASSLICRSVRRVFKYALERGVHNVLFYGDVCDKPSMSSEAQCQFLDTLLREEYRDLTMHFVLGNHDFHENGDYSLRFLEVIADRVDFNIKVYTKPKIVNIDGVPFKMLPYPYEETEKGAVNVIHFEVAGSTRDNGRQIDEGPSNSHFCLAGHLHTPHVVRNTHYSGTLYQTNFGESMPKFFHHAKIHGVKDYEVTQVPFKPPWELNNLIVEAPRDLKKIREEAHILYKLFVKDGADIDINAVLSKHHNVVKHNAFKSKRDLKQQIEEAWEFDSDLIAQEVEPIDDKAFLTDYLLKKGAKPKQIKRGVEIIKGLSR